MAKKSNFAKGVKKALKEQGVSQKDFAKKIKKTPVTVSKWLNDVTEPSLSDAAKVAKTLKIKLDDLT